MGGAAGTHDGAALLVRDCCSAGTAGGDDDLARGGNERSGAGGVSDRFSRLSSRESAWSSFGEWAGAGGSALRTLGTVKTASHLGHFAILPAVAAGSFSFVPQAH